MYTERRLKGSVSRCYRNTIHSPLTRPTRILLVDDQQELRWILNRFLSAAGYDVSEASNGAEGLQRLLSEPVDLVVTDIGMPVKDGLTMIEDAATLAPDVPFVIYSGSVEEELMRSKRFRELNILNVVQKPMLGHEFVAVVQDSMNRVIRGSVEMRGLDSNSVVVSSY